jgi:hypothetical protein
MKLVHQLLLFVATLSFTQHSQHVEGQPVNFGIVDKVRNLIQKVLHVNPQWSSESSQYNATTYFPMAQTSQYFVATNFPIYSEGIHQQDEVSTLPQDSVSDTGQTSQYFVATDFPIYSEGIHQQVEVSTLPQDSVNDIDQTSQYFVPNYFPISSEGIHQQVEVSTLPQDSVNDIDQDVPEARIVIDAPLINNKCEDGYRAVKGRCKKEFGRRRR